MSFKTKIIKTAVKWTPKSLILWVANIVLKDIAELSDFSVDLDARTSFVKVQLLGEADAIEIAFEGFAIIAEEDAYKFILQSAKSNRLWLDNIFGRITGKAWKIPAIPQLAAHMPLVSDLLKAQDEPAPEAEVLSESVEEV